MAQLTIEPDGAALMDRASGWLGAEVRDALAARGRCALALSGGRTPEPLYRQLAAEPGIAWERVDVFFADERAVRADDPDSNYLMAREALLSRVPIPAERVHRIEAERPDLDASARAYERSLPPHLDLLLLGIGADGHTASLFPGSAALAERERRVVPSRAPTPPVQRVTITPPVIEAARVVMMIATGRAKAAAVALALEGDWAPSDVPAQLARSAHWFLDEAAAGRLALRGGVR